MSNSLCRWILNPPIFVRLCATAHSGQAHPLCIRFIQRKPHDAWVSFYPCGSRWIGKHPLRTNNRLTVRLCASTYGTIPPQA